MKKSYILSLFVTLMASGLLQAQNFAVENGMLKKKNNFTQLTIPKKSNSDFWKEYNHGAFRQHPEYGIIPFNGPKENVVEVLEKRTETERYFIKMGESSTFYVQQSLQPLHYWENGYWRTIESAMMSLGAGEFQSRFYYEPAGFSKSIKKSYINTQAGKIHFNEWTLFKKVNGQSEFLANANWDEFSIGDDGVYINNVFEGIDAEMIVRNGSIETNFIMKSNEYGPFDGLVFRDHFTSDQNLTLTFMNDANQNEMVGPLDIKKNGTSVLQMDEGIAYTLNGQKTDAIPLSYKIDGQFAEVEVPYSWIQQHIHQNHLVIDPTVTATNTLFQNQINGSMYNSSCNFNNSCNYNLSVNFPANATITNVTTNFDYKATSICWLNDGATRFSSGGCLSPNQSGYYWFCNNIGGGTCLGNNVPIYSDISGCMPGPSCFVQAIPFTLQFFRTCYGASGCSNTCIGANSNWSVTVTGKTLEFSNPSSPISVSATTICKNGSVTASASGAFGVPPYTYNWSFNSNGTPSLGTSSSVTAIFPNAGTQPLYLTITDKCGQSISSFININVQDNVIPTFTPLGQICQNSTANLPATSNNGISGTWSPAFSTASIGSTTYTFTPNAGQGCAGSNTMLVEIIAPVMPSFTQIGPFCKNASASLATTSNNGISGIWSPSFNTSIAGSTNYTFTPTAGQGCNGTATMTVVVNDNILPVFSQPGPLCKNAPFSLPTTSNNGITGSWSPAFSSAAVGSTTYTFTPGGGQGCVIPTTMTIVISDNILPTFTQLGPICKNATGSLPATSNNGISGSWSPAFSSASSGTTTYTFTPSGGQNCVLPTTMDVVVNENVLPLFSPLDTICKNAAGSLPSVSNNGISGTWSPLFSTANVGSTSYTFTPNSGQGCVLSTIMNVVVIDYILPSFTQIGPLCKNEAGSLPLISNNGVSGSWSPAFSSTTAGNTTYTFTPNAGQGCVSVATMNVVINDNIIPAFTQVGPLCKNATGSLPATSNNGITGVWSPAFSTSIAGTTTYSFSPNAGQGCVLPTTMTVIINDNTLPLFTQLSPICKNATASLPATSNNGIIGVWSPVFSTSTVGTSIYTFTPNAGQGCVLQTTMTVTVNDNILPAFTQMGPLCKNVVANLPTTSTNGITGNWSPAFSTTTPGSATYTFTPTTGQGCVLTTTMDVVIIDNILPVFTQVGPLCKNESGSLPITSNNGITGSWSPAFSTSTAGTSTYTFTPGAGQGCVLPVTMVVVIIDNTLPVFTPLGTLCKNSTGSLPTTSNNNITGTWSPVFSTTTAGSNIYTFTPNSGQGCVLSTSMTVTVIDNTIPVFNQLGPLCKNSVANLPSTSNNGITGTWSPAFSTAMPGSTTYTFTPTGTLGCVASTTMTVVINDNIQPTFTQLAPLCKNAVGNLPVTSNNGITGTWSPAFSTSNPGTTTYTFTPDPGQGCVLTSTMDVEIYPEVVETTIDTTICFGESIVFNNVNYTQSVNTSAIFNSSKNCDSTSNLNLIVLTPPISIIDTLQNCNSVVFQGKTYTSNAIVYDTIRYSGFNCDSIYFKHVIIIKPTVTFNDTIRVDICKGDSFVFHGGTYHQTGNYTEVYLNSMGCDSLITLNLIVHELPVISIHNIDNRNSLCLGDSILLKGAGALNYTWWSPPNAIWGNGEELKILLPFKENTIWVKGYDQWACSDSASVIIAADHCCEVFLPNAFSPNNDGLNDKFGATILGNPLEYNLMIFDRLGQKVFQSFNLNQQWDGFINQKAAGARVYYFYLQGRCSDGSYFEKKGEVTLIN